MYFVRTRHRVFFDNLKQIGRFSHLRKIPAVQNDGMKGRLTALEKYHRCITIAPTRACPRSSHELLHCDQPPYLALEMRRSCSRVSATHNTVASLPRPPTPCLSFCAACCGYRRGSRGEESRIRARIQGARTTITTAASCREGCSRDGSGNKPFARSGSRDGRTG